MGFFYILMPGGKEGESFHLVFVADLLGSRPASVVAFISLPFCLIARKGTSALAPSTVSYA